MQQSDLEDLLTLDRELTIEERTMLRSVGEVAWRDVETDLPARSRITYAIESRDELRRCIEEHLDVQARLDMAAAEAYHCCVCGRLLKDRRTPIASAILQERRRLRQLWTQVLTTEGEEQSRAMRRFAAALGRHG